MRQCKNEVSVTLLPSEGGQGTVYCFDYQEEVLKGYMGGEAAVKGIVREKAI